MLIIASHTVLTENFPLGGSRLHPYPPKINGNTDNLSVFHSLDFHMTCLPRRVIHHCSNIPRGRCHSVLFHE
jgi:hypothetical protein